MTASTPSHGASSTPSLIPGWYLLSRGFGSQAFDLFEADLLRQVSDATKPHAAFRRLDRTGLSAADLLPQRSAVTHSVTEPDREAIRGEGKGFTFVVMRSDATVMVGVAAESASQASEIADEIDRRGRPAPQAGSTPIDVWHHNGVRGSSTSRQLPTPPWEAASCNYPAIVRSHLDEVMAMQPPTASGAGLLLFHGPPGTGKTTALRSLLGEWADWCDAAYVADPDRLFRDVSYLLDLIGREPDGDDDRWKLVIAEDCDEYLHARRREQAGGGLGRVLNVADGILGQDQRVLLLFTTNEEVGRLHPAVTRPGRCLANVAFTPFDFAGAERWLGCPPAEGSDLTLASLLAQRGDLDGPSARLPELTTGAYL